MRIVLILDFPDSLRNPRAEVDKVLRLVQRYALVDAFLERLPVEPPNDA